MSCVGNYPEESKKGLDWNGGCSLERTEQMPGSLQRFSQEDLLYVWRARVREKSEVLLTFVEMYYIMARKSLWRLFDIKPTKSVTFKLRLYPNALGIIWGEGG